MQATDLLAHLYLSVGRLRPPRRHSPCILPRSTRANHCAQDQLDIANFLRAGTRFRKALSRVLDYAYWRAQEGDTNPTVLLYDQSIHPLFSRNNLCLCPVQTSYEALEFFGTARRVLEARDPDGVDNYLF